VSEQNYLRADSLALREDPKDPVRKFAMLQAFKTGNHAEFERLSSEIVQRPAVPLYGAMDLAVMDPQAAEDFALEIQKRRTRPVGRSNGYFVLSVLDFEQGQLNSALARMDSAGASMLDAKATFATMPLANLPRERLQAIYDEVAASDSTPADYDGTPRSVRPQFRLYQLGMLSCRLGNTAQALEFARRVETMPVAPHWKESMSALATNVRAQVDLANGDPKQALARLESIATDPPMDLLFTPASRLTETMWRAELLYLTGRNDEAIAWFENIDDFVIYEVPIYSYALLRRAELLERKGQTREAMALYSQVLKHWRAADAAFQPYVTQARNALDRLQRKVG
jgi:tetratricopeptide (TPR) repeat protein